MTAIVLLDFVTYIETWTSDIRYSPCMISCGLKGDYGHDMILRSSQVRIMMHDFQRMLWRRTGLAIVEYESQTIHVFDQMVSTCLNIHHLSYVLISISDALNTVIQISLIIADSAVNHAQDFVEIYSLSQGLYNLAKWQ